MTQFKDWLKKQKYDSKLNAQSPFTLAFDNLTKVKDDLTSVVAKRGLDVSLDEGWLVDLGQQYRFMVKLAAGDFDHILFRAYIASNGQITFDFGDEIPTMCDWQNADAVLETVGKCLERDTTIGTIQQLTKLA